MLESGNSERGLVRHVFFAGKAHNGLALVGFGRHIEHAGRKPAGIGGQGGILYGDFSVGLRLPGKVSVQGDVGIGQGYGVAKSVFFRLLRIAHRQVKLRGLAQQLAVKLLLISERIALRNRA